MRTWMSVLLAAFGIVLLDASALASPKTVFSPEPQDPPGRTLTEAEILRMVGYFKQFTYELEQPVYTYHWSKSAGANPGTSSTDPQAFRYFTQASATYWNEQGHGGVGNMYGRGLYLATDPLATDSFGGLNQDWVLLEVRLPQGFRMLDLAHDGFLEISESIYTLLAEAGCPKSWTVGGSTQLALIMGPKEGASTTCLATIRSIFKDHLKIDGFGYQYEATRFEACETARNLQSNRLKNPRSTAFVITNPDLFKQGDIKLFTSRTSDAKADRQRIESLFYRFDADESQHADAPPSTQEIAAVLRAHPGYSYVRHQEVSLGGGRQLFFAQLKGPRGLIEQFQFPPRTMNFPEKISSANPPQNGAHKSQKLLWSDLDGQSTTKDLSAWIKSNLYGCNGHAPYKSAFPHEPAKKVKCEARAGADSLEQVKSLGDTVQSACEALPSP